MFDALILIAAILYAAWLGVWTGMLAGEPDIRFWSLWEIAWRWAIGWVFPAIWLAGAVVWLCCLPFALIRDAITRKYL